MSIIAPRSTDSFFKAPREFAKRGANGFPIGKRTKQRQAENAKLNKLEIRSCEVRLPHRCVGSVMLTWAHSKKSRFLVTSKDWQEAARCCLPCHDFIESLPHSEMKRIVQEAIARRKA